MRVINIMAATENKKRIVILGGGFAGVYVLKGLHRLFRHNRGIEITLIDKKGYFVFTPLLSEVATGGQQKRNVIEPLPDLSGKCRAGIKEEEVKEINLQTRKVITDQGEVEYDYLVIALGAVNNDFGIKGVEEYALPFKNVADAADLKKRCLRLFKEASRENEPEKLKELLSIAVVGGGPTGVEVAAELAEWCYGVLAKTWLSREKRKYISLSLIQREGEVLMILAPKLRRKAEKILLSKGIKMMMQATVAEIGEGEIKLADGEKVRAGTIVWAAGVKSVAGKYLKEQLPADRAGRIVVEPALNLAKHKEVFVLGDAAGIVQADGSSVPMLAQAAEQEAIVVARNIYNSIKKQALDKFVYRSGGTLVSLGPWQAVAEIGRVKISGPLAWWLWRTVYLIKMISWRQRWRAMLDWTIRLFYSRDIAED